MISFSTGVGEEEIGKRETRYKISSCKRVSGWNVRGGCCMECSWIPLAVDYLAGSYRTVTLQSPDQEWGGGNAGTLCSSGQESLS